MDVEAALARGIAQYAAGEPGVGAIPVEVTAPIEEVRHIEEVTEEVSDDG